jgi:hypothetical protein
VPAANGNQFVWCAVCLVYSDVPILPEVVPLLHVCSLQKDAEAAAAGGLLGRLRSNKTIPSSWTHVLGQVGS